jgi:hypothetical protein
MKIQVREQWTLETYGAFGRYGEEKVTRIALAIAKLAASPENAYAFAAIGAAGVMDICRQIKRMQTDIPVLDQTAMFSQTKLASVEAPSPLVL